MKKFLNLLDKIEEILCNVCLLGMLMVLSLQVILRYIFRNSNAWSDEVGRYLFGLYLLELVMLQKTFRI